MVMACFAVFFTKDIQAQDQDQQKTMISIDHQAGITYTALIQSEATTVMDVGKFLLSSQTMNIGQNQIISDDVGWQTQVITVFQDPTSLEFNVLISYLPKELNICQLNSNANLQNEASVRMVHRSNGINSLNAAVEKSNLVARIKHEDLLWISNIGYQADANMIDGRSGETKSNKEGPASGVELTNEGYQAGAMNLTGAFIRSEQATITNKEGPTVDVRLTNEGYRADQENLVGVKKIEEQRIINTMEGTQVVELINEGYKNSIVSSMTVADNMNISAIQEVDLNSSYNA